MSVIEAADEVNAVLRRHLRRSQRQWRERCARRGREQLRALMRTWTDGWRRLGGLLTRGWRSTRRQALQPARAVA